MQNDELFHKAIAFVGLMTGMSYSQIRKPKSKPEGHARMLVCGILASEGVGDIIGGELFGIPSRRFRESAVNSYELEHFKDVFDLWPEYRDKVDIDEPFKTPQSYAESLLPKKVQDNILGVWFTWQGTKHLARFEKSFVDGEYRWKFMDMEIAY